jgi:DNA-directed RNA polymerase
VHDNLYDIINYENGKLLENAKEKVLFLAFCIEYKKYPEFINDDELSEFKSYLPVQLDATCNGFQHLALLSNEKKIFEVLNLTNTDKEPKDFYSFLLHKLCFKL